MVTLTIKKKDNPKLDEAEEEKAKKKTVVIKPNINPYLDKYRNKENYRIVQTNVTRKDGTKGTNLLVRRTDSSGNVREDIRGGTEGSPSQTITTDKYGNKYIYRQEEVASKPQEPSFEKLKQRELQRRDMEREGTQFPNKPSYQYVPLRTPEEMQRMTRNSEKPIDPSKFERGQTVVTSGGNKRFVFTGTTEPTKQPPKPWWRINPVEDFEESLERIPKEQQPETAVQQAAGWLADKQEEFEESKTGQWLEQNLGRQHRAVEEAVASRTTRPAMQFLEKQEQELGVKSPAQLVAEVVEEAGFPYGGRAIRSFESGVREVVANEPVTTAFTFAAGGLVGAGSKLLSATKVGKVVATTVGIAGTTAYVGGVGISVATSPDPWRIIGKESVGFAAFSAGAHLGAGATKVAPKPKVLGKKLSLKQALKRGGFNRKEIVEFYGEKGGKAYDRALTKQRIASDKSLKKEPFTQIAQSDNRVAVEVKRREGFVSVRKVDTGTASNRLISLEPRQGSGGKHYTVEKQTTLEPLRSRYLTSEQFGALRDVGFQEPQIYTSTISKTKALMRSKPRPLPSKLLPPESKLVKNTVRTPRETIETSSTGKPLYFQEAIRTSTGTSVKPSNKLQPSVRVFVEGKEVQLGKDVKGLQAEFAAEYYSRPKAKPSARVYSDEMSFADVAYKTTTVTKGDTTTISLRPRVVEKTFSSSKLDSFQKVYENKFSAFNNAAKFQSSIAKSGLGGVGMGATLTAGLKPGRTVVKPPKIILKASEILEQASSNKSKSETKQESRSIVKQALKTKQKTKQDTKQKLKVAVMVKQKTKQQVKQGVFQKQASMSKQITEQSVQQKVATDQVQVITTRTKPILIQPPEPRIKKPTPVIPPPRRPRLPRPMRFGKPVRAFDVFVKKRGRYVKVNVKPLTQKSALGKGVQVTKGTATRSFFIKPTKGKATAKTFGFDIYKTLKKMYRSPKSGKGYVEKTKYAIDSPGELKEITYKGLMSRGTRPF